ncbi:MAG: M48 family metallopeptidase [Azoarcus sp.]|nr:M48 family metallopeptidase [Azoarcus sp.]
MDFFAAQDHARRVTRLLVLWFAIAVALIVCTVYLGVSFMLSMGDELSPARPALWDGERFVATALAVGGLILAASLYKIAVLAGGGGAAVATSLGGRLVPRATTDALERRLINVVDEMAIASGIPSPPVYVLDGEPAINAFAAGARPQQAVVAVTRGTLEQLSRDELQGVVAHEFSHILNGDMRLNLRLIGVLHGILVLALLGRILLRSGGRGSGKKEGAPLLVLGVVLMVTGYAGVLCGKLIKAAVSRQREFLADASAVQFTRNPAGIAGALKRIGGYGTTISHPRGEEVSHMLFGSGSALSGLFATHPPIAERIRRIDRSFEAAPAKAPVMAATASTEAAAAAGFAGGHMAPPPAARPTGPNTPLAAPAEPTSSPPASAPAALAAAVGTLDLNEIVHARQLIERLPAVLRRSLETPFGAQATCIAVLLAIDATHADTGLALVRSRLGDDMAREVSGHLANARELGAAGRLPLVELALAALHELDSGARENFLATADALVRNDGRVSLTEYLLARLLADGLHPRPARPLLKATSHELRRHCATLLSVLALVGQRDRAQAAAAYARGAAAAPLDQLGPMLSAGEFGLKGLDQAFELLAGTAPAFRKRLVQAMAEVAAHDGRIRPIEAEVMRASCEALDCPLPPSLGGLAGDEFLDLRCQ